MKKLIVLALTVSGALALSANAAPASTHLAGLPFVKVADQNNAAPQPSNQDLAQIQDDQSAGVANDPSSDDQADNSDYSNNDNMDNNASTDADSADDGDTN